MQWSLNPLNTTTVFVGIHVFIGYSYRDSEVQIVTLATNLYLVFCFLACLTDRVTFLMEMSVSLFWKENGMKHWNNLRSSNDSEAPIEKLLQPSDVHAKLGGN